MPDDRRLIEDFLPIQAIGKEASREKSVRKGHISTLHLWWARRPLVACRAAVYGALVPASRFIPENGPDNKKQSLGRANAAKFLERLCKYPGEPAVIREAQRHILEAHAERLSREMGKAVTVEDIEAGRAPRPKVLDMFAGGGAIPLEALRLGCEAYALDLNPVAHIILLCTLVYPQKYGKPDPNARGMTGPKNARGDHLGRAGQRGALLGRVGAPKGEGRDRRPVPADSRPRIQGPARGNAELLLADRKG
jgi:putative DNA methylase